jgi:hypothetical protein
MPAGSPVHASSGEAAGAASHGGSRWDGWALAAVAAGALGLRLLSLLGPGGPLASPTGYDDGVYFSASALLVRGVLPYRDFVFVHPPGALYVFALVSWLADPARGFVAARFLAAVAGAANTFFVGRIAARASGPAGGLAAASLYAAHPDAAAAERGAFLEPVLNLACLAMALVWLGPARERAWRAIGAGLLLGAACAVKAWGAFWVVAALASPAPGRARAELVRLLAAAALCAGLLLAPLALADLRAFITDTVLFQSWRPPDGIASSAERLGAMYGGPLLATSALALLGVAASTAAARRGIPAVPRETRLMAVAALLTTGAFLLSASYWNGYNSHLAASQCALAGLGAGALASLARRRLRPWGSALAALLIAAAVVPSLSATLERARTRSDELPAMARAVRSVVPPGECLFAFDPGWGLAGGRLPAHGDGAPTVVDSYGAMLLAAVRSGARFPSAAAAFEQPAAQRDVRARLEGCRFAILGERGGWQLDAAGRAWFEGHFLCQAAAAGLCVAERTDRRLDGLALTARGAVHFGEGWFAEEGARPDSWRWSSQRAVTLLPGSRGPTRLALVLHVPLAELGSMPSIALALDGRPLDRFVARQSEVVRLYDLVDPDDGEHILVLATSRTFQPSADGRSRDRRELGVTLRRLAWLPRDGGRARLPSPR